MDIFARTCAPLLALALVTGLPGTVAAARDCESIRCDAQAEIDAACPCDESNHGRYVSCVAHAAKRAGVPPGCRDNLVSCAARSVCGKEGRVICNLPVFGTCDLGSGTCVGTSSPCGSFTDCVTGTRCKRAWSAEQCERAGGTVSDAKSCCECGGVPPTTIPTPTTTSTTGPTATSTSSSTSTTSGGSTSTSTSQPAATTSTSSTTMQTATTTSTSSTTSTTGGSATGAFVASPTRKTGNGNGKGHAYGHENR